jgi:hypothetical protein
VPLRAASAPSRQEARHTGAQCRESGDDVVKVANPVVTTDVQDEPEEEHQGDRKRASRYCGLDTAPNQRSHLICVGKFGQFLEQYITPAPVDGNAAPEWRYAWGAVATTPRRTAGVTELHGLAPETVASGRQIQ